MTIGEIVGLDAGQLATAIRGRDISCAEVMDAYLDQIARFNPVVNAIVSMPEREVLLAEAAERDRALARGEFRGWLHGFPFAVKDLSDVAGLPTTRGSSIFASEIAQCDSLFVSRIRASGAVFVGKTNTPEFGLGSQTFNAVFGTTLNAYDQARCAGGSSGGAAVALAMRMLPVADGTDFMGSLRNPAAFNNVIGFRPSIGRVPDRGFLASPSVAGPMARTVDDAAKLLSIMAGPDPHSPSAIEQDPAIFARPQATAARAVRVAWVADFDGYLPMEPGVLRLCESALLVLQGLGCVVEPAIPQMPPDLVWETFVTWRHLLMYESLRRLHENPETRTRLKPEAIWEIAGGKRLTVDEILLAHEHRSRWFEAVTTLLDRFDVIAAPSAQVFPFDARIHWPAEIEGRPMDTYHRWMETVAPWSLAGLPVLNVPVGFDARGLPMGMQLVGRSHADLDVLRLGSAYDQVTRWPSRELPPLLRD